MKNLIATILLASSIGINSINLDKDNFKYARNETNIPLNIGLNQIGWINNVEYINQASGQVKFYRYSFQIAYVDSNIEAILEETNFLYFDLPLNYLSYDPTSTAVDLCIIQVDYDQTIFSLPIMPLFPTLGVFDTTGIHLFVVGDTIQFIIPTTHTVAISQYQNALDNVRVYNRSGVLTGLPIYNTGYKDGELSGYQSGYNAGLQDGAENQISYSWLRGLFGGMGDLLSIRLFGDITIGSIALIMLSLTLLPFIIGLAKGKD